MGLARSFVGVLPAVRRVVPVRGALVGIFAITGSVLWGNAFAGPQCDGVVPGAPVTTFGGITMTVWDSDGAGPLPESLILAAQSGSPLRNQVLRRIGSEWEAIGEDFNGPVLALGVVGGRLIAGGGFTTVGGRDAARIAQWDGSKWEPVGAGFNGKVAALCEFRGELVAAGEFSRSGAAEVKQIGAWDGVAWRSLQTGVQFPLVQALRVFQGKLIVGGDFNSIGGVNARAIASFDGAVWSRIGNGIGNGGIKIVYGLGEYEGRLIAGGHGLGDAGILAWDGAAWGPIGSGIMGMARSFAVRDGMLYAGGSFSQRGGENDRGCVAVWDRQRWSAVGIGEVELDEQVRHGEGARCLSWSGDRLFATGNFYGFVSSSVAQWNGTEWLPVNDTLKLTFAALTPFQGRFVAAGNFLRSGERRTNHVMAWTGEEWEGFGAGLRSAAFAAIGYNGELVVSGGSPRELPDNAGSISAWNGSGWRSLGKFDAGKAGLLCEYQGRLIAAGEIRPSATIDANGVAVWNGALWNGLGTGIVLSTSQSIRAVQPFGGRLIVAGVFTNAGSLPVSNMAAWDGTSWGHAGGGTAGPVNSIVIWSGKLIVGGEFAYAGDSPVQNVAAWDGIGTIWTSLGQPGEVLQLVVYEGELLARVSGKTLMQRWTGATWVDFPFDPSALVAVMDGEIATIRSATGGMIAEHALPRYVSGEPMLPTQPRKPLAYCGAPASISVIADNVGDNTPSYRWRRGGTPLLDGPTGTGSVLFGVSSETLTIANVGQADAGNYDVEVVNACGSTVSNVTQVEPDCCPADLTGDGIVDDGDVSEFVGAYNTMLCAEIGPPCYADFNRDGVVNDLDFQVFVRGYDQMTCE